MARPAKAISTTNVRATTTAVWPDWRLRRRSERNWWFISVLRLHHAYRFDVEVGDEIRDDRDPGLESVLHLDSNLANLARGSTWRTTAGAKAGGVRRPAGTDRRPDIDV